MADIALQRKFVHWITEDQVPVEMPTRWASQRNMLGWPDLLKLHRVVILAEPGSGKTAELREQRRQRTHEGHPAFFATLQDVGRYGVRRSIGRQSEAELDRWKSSDQDAWFFFDSIDEAKGDNVRLEWVLQQIADEISGAERRAHVVLSGRYTNWEFRRDLATLIRQLSLPVDTAAAPPNDSAEMVIEIVKGQRRKEAHDDAQEPPAIVIMTPLDRRRVQIFAQGKGIQDLKHFLAALDDNDLWDLARRPLDLEWLVEYWDKSKRLGTLSEMLEKSLTTRLREREGHRGRADPLDVASALHALERIGAAMVLQRVQDIALPDSDLSFERGRRALKLPELFHDHSVEFQRRLLDRAVFDPASAGFCRIHNDNEGVVRSYLAARWFERLKKAGCPYRVLARQLFATKYGVDVVKPSMRQTAAWLAVRDPDIANEIVRRDPRLLMDAGDPASLPDPLRQEVVGAIVGQMLSDHEFDMPSHDHLRRFSAKCLAATIRTFWRDHSCNQAVRKLLLSLIWLGEIGSCADIARGATFGSFCDRDTVIYSGRALLATASDTDKRRYGRYVHENAAALPSYALWDAIDGLFPIFLSVDQFLGILRASTIVQAQNGFWLSHYGPLIAERLTSSEEAARLVVGLIGFTRSEDEADEEADQYDASLYPLIRATAQRLFTLEGGQVTSDAVVDAALHLMRGRDHGLNKQDPEDDGPDFVAELNATPANRRRTLWRACQMYGTHRLFREVPVSSVWEIGMVGFAPTLLTNDKDWLLEDAIRRPLPNERQVAANAFMSLWRDEGSDPARLAHMQKIASEHPEVAKVVENWMRPKPTEVANEKQRRSRQRRRDQEEARLQTWRTFHADLRADPEQLRRIKHNSGQHLDTRLFQLWQILCAARKEQGFAISDLSPLEPMFGIEVVTAFRDTIIDFWRMRQPVLRAEREEKEKNSVNQFDLIGLMGISLEATSHRGWANKLNHHEAWSAATYATLGFEAYPFWLSQLAEAQPDIVRNVFERCLAPELDPKYQGDFPDTLRRLGDADDAVLVLVVPTLLAHLEAADRFNVVVLEASIEIMLRAVEAGRLKEVLAPKLHATQDLDVAVILISALFRLSPSEAVSALLTKADGLRPEKRTDLVHQVLAAVFNKSWNSIIDPVSIPDESLKQLVDIAFEMVRPEDDNVHPEGVGYSPNFRDKIQEVRSMLFRTLVERPGMWTYDVIQDYIKQGSSLRLPEKRLLSLAHERAGNDAEHDPWAPQSIVEFENSFLSLPRTTADLLSVALERLDDIQHSLLHSDFALGRIFASLASEREVQIWLADRLRSMQGNSYSVEREPNLADEKEPDIRLRARLSDASIPIEIKIVSSWSVSQLETALTRQLIGQYLRERSAKHGILLLVQQEQRKIGWKPDDKPTITFEDVVAHLTEMAREVASATSDAPQPEIAVLDVSSVTSAGPSTRRKVTKKAKTERQVDSRNG